VFRFPKKHFLEKRVLTKECLDIFLAIHNQFDLKRKVLLLESNKRLSQFQLGIPHVDRPDTRAIRQQPWTTGVCPQNLERRQVEITAPPNKKEVVNALAGKSDVFMADFEDSLCPTWPNILGGHYNMMKAIKKKISFFDENRQKDYFLKDISAQIFIRPRSL